jgi:Tat protein translocase TatB subunit
MFGTLGGPELFLILVVALIVFGPTRLPDIGKSMGKMLAEFRKASNELKRTLEEEVEQEKKSHGNKKRSFNDDFDDDEPTALPPANTEPSTIGSSPAQAEPAAASQPSAQVQESEAAPIEPK